MARIPRCAEVEGPSRLPERACTWLERRCWPWTFWAGPGWGPGPSITRRGRGQDPLQQARCALHCLTLGATTSCSSCPQPLARLQPRAAPPPASPPSSAETVSVSPSVLGVTEKLPSCPPRCPVNVRPCLTRTGREAGVVRACVNDEASAAPPGSWVRWWRPAPRSWLQVLVPWGPVVAQQGSTHRSLLVCRLPGGSSKYSVPASRRDSFLPTFVIFQADRARVFSGIAESCCQ